MMVGFIEDQALRRDCSTTWCLGFIVPLKWIEYACYKGIVEKKMEIVFEGLGFRVWDLGFRDLGFFRV